MTVSPALLLIWAATATFAQSFEVASIRLHDHTKPTAGPPGLFIAGNRISMLSVTPFGLITTAYEVKSFQVLNAPAWADRYPDAYYDIYATSANGATLTNDEVRAPLRSLLSDRFGLRVHEETREIAVYNLTAVKAGSKLVRTAPETRFSSRQSPAPESRNGILMASANVTMAQLVGQLNVYTDRPVIDKSGLEGGYDFTLKWLQEDRNGAPSTEAASGGLPSLITALREQLGLTLEPAKTSMKVIVVDRIERPSDN